MFILFKAFLSGVIKALSDSVHITAHLNGYTKPQVLVVHLHTAGAVVHLYTAGAVVHQLTAGRVPECGI